ncbi:MAG: hypothetical protein VX127_00670 [Myxococcota bacterium]|nr:hypothetical protein [Myxococcota bacterium]
MIFVLIACLVAHAVPQPAPTPATVHIEATVSDDLRTISGTIVVPHIDGVQWVDLLEKLPIPAGDRMQHRTFPVRPEQGTLTLEVASETQTEQRFHTVLPRRFGASGVVPRRGLFANGLWHPHPASDGQPAVVNWDVTLTLPTGSTGVLNGVVAQERLHYSGTADRLSLAVLHNARVQTIPIADNVNMTLVDAGPRRIRRDSRTIALAMKALDHTNAASFTVVETPLRRRLLRIGPSTLFMSDRALRVTPPEWGLHVPALQQGLQRASLRIADPWLRDVAGSALVMGIEPERPPPAVSNLLPWVPRIDSFLYDGRVPFGSEALDEGWAVDHIEDDALEMLGPATPASTAAWKLGALHGTDTVQKWATAMASGASVDHALDASGLKSTDFSAAREAAPITDIRVDVARTQREWEVRLSRTAPMDARAEPVPYVLNGERGLWITETGPSSETFTLDEKPKTVSLDPEQRVRQTNQQNDAWPRPVSFTLTGSLSEISINQRRLTGSLFMVRRNQRSSRWIHTMLVQTNPIEIASTFYSLSYEFGRKLDQRNRIWRAWTGPSASILEPAFRESRDARYAIDYRGGLRIDTRDNWPFSRRGYRFAAAISNGFIPGQDDQWRAWSSDATVLVDLPGPLVWANRFKAGATTSEVAHRQFSIGGSAGVQGVPIDAYFGQAQTYATTELRYRPVRDASIPMGLWWLTAFQVSGSIEVAKMDDATAAGWTVGLATVYDFWGQTPSIAGIWIARSIDYGDFSGPYPVQVYLKAGQNF